MNLLTVVKRKEIEATIIYIRSKLNEEKYQKQYNLFWVYFNKVWLNQYDFNIWNTSCIRNVKKEHIQCKSNNAIENDNKQSHALFIGAHPSIYTWITKVKERCRLKLDLIKEKKKCLSELNRREVVKFYEIPNELIKIIRPNLKIRIQKPCGCNCKCNQDETEIETGFESIEMMENSESMSEL